MLAWFLLRDREGVDMDSRGDGKELRGGGGNCNQDIVCEGTIYFLRHIRPSASTSQRRNWTQAVWPNFILTVSWSQSTPRACIVPIAQCISATSSQNSCNCPLPTSKRISTHKMKGEQEDESSPPHTHSCLPCRETHNPSPECFDALFAASCTQDMEALFLFLSFKCALFL